jgi:hypothetical protein
VHYNTQRLQNTLMSRAVRVWAQCTRMQSRVGYRVGGLMKRWARAAFAAVFSRWKLYAKVCQRMHSAVGQEAVQSLVRCGVAALHVWRDKARAVAKIRGLVARRRVLTCGTCMVGWALVVRHQCSKAVREGRATRTRCQGLLSKVWRRWHTCTCWAAAKAKSLVKIRQACARRLLFGAIETWRHIVYMSVVALARAQRLERTCSVLEVRRKRKLLCAILAAMHGAAYTGKSMSAKCARIYARKRLVTCSRALMLWSRVCARARIKAAAKKHGWEAATCLHAWAEYAREASQLRQALSTLQHTRLRLMVISALAHWHSAALASAKDVAKVAALRHKRSTSAAAGTLAEWRCAAARGTHLRCLDKLLIRRRGGQRLRSAWTCWLHAVNRIRQLRHSCSCLSAALRKRTLRDALERWSCKPVRWLQEQRQGCALLAHRRDVGAMRSAFDVWRHAAAWPRHAGKMVRKQDMRRRRCMVQQVLRCWSRRVHAHSHCLSQNFARHCIASHAKLLAKTFSAWLYVVHLCRRQARAARQRDTRACAHVWGVWGDNIRVRKAVCGLAARKFDGSRRRALVRWAVHVARSRDHLLLVGALSRPRRMRKLVAAWCLWCRYAHKQVSCRRKCVRFHRSSLGRHARIVLQLWAAHSFNMRKVDRTFAAHSAHLCVGAAVGVWRRVALQYGCLRRASIARKVRLCGLVCVFWRKHMEARRALRVAIYRVTIDCLHCMLLQWRAAASRWHAPPCACGAFVMDFVCQPVCSRADALRVNLMMRDAIYGYEVNTRSHTKSPTSLRHLLFL